MTTCHANSTADEHERAVAAWVDSNAAVWAVDSYGERLRALLDGLNQLGGVVAELFDVNFVVCLERRRGERVRVPLPLGNGRELQEDVP